MASAALTPQQTLDAFFGDFYLRAYAGSVDEEEASRQAVAAARLAGCAPGAAVLDVACGFARHAVPLAAEGFRVTGVDRSDALLTEGRRRADAAGGAAA
ncbi:MAG TPA: methyltransferase domain-containing protein, partial [Solirubrobacteraceae bacterium]|nr:methyltransferase domain-containing protein [Solirubrobacteraceae bacterium]